MLFPRVGGLGGDLGEGRGVHPALDADEGGIDDDEDEEMPFAPDEDEEEDDGKRF